MTQGRQERLASRCSLWQRFPLVSGARLSGSAGRAARLPRFHGAVGVGMSFRRDALCRKVSDWCLSHEVTFHGAWGNEWGNTPHRFQPISADLDLAEAA
jgi:hypothetical protein